MEDNPHSRAATGFTSSLQRACVPGRAEEPSASRRAAEHARPTTEKQRAMPYGSGQPSSGIRGSFHTPVHVLTDRGWAGFRAVAARSCESGGPTPEPRRRSASVNIRKARSTDTQSTSREGPAAPTPRRAAGAVRPASARTRPRKSSPPSPQPTAAHRRRWARCWTPTVATTPAVDRDLHG